LSLVLASYNAGPGNVSKAIRRSGGSQTIGILGKPPEKKNSQCKNSAFLATM
jgi:membrane-bound lytic murein transglycosylase D